MKGYITPGIIVVLLLQTIGFAQHPDKNFIKNTVYNHPEQPPVASGWFYRDTGQRIDLAARHETPSYFITASNVSGDIRVSITDDQLTVTFNATMNNGKIRTAHQTTLIHTNIPLPDLYLGDLSCDNYPNVIRVSVKDNMLYFEQNYEYGYITSLKGTFTVNLHPLHTSAAETIEKITYLDGLGRPIQQTGIRQTPDRKNLVSHSEYDRFGREATTFLAYPSQADDAGFEDNLPAKISAYYWERFSDMQPTAVKKLENSPLNRVLKQGAAGSSWQTDWNQDTDHTIKYQYTFNKATDKVRLFKVASGTTSNALADAGYFPANSLTKTITKDENWKPGQPHPVDNTTVEFKDKQDRLILKRTHDNGKWHDTYYVFDDFGNLTYVLPPQLNTYPNEQQIWRDESYSEENSSTFYVPVAGFNFYNEYYISINNNALSIYFDDFGQGPQGVALNTTTPVFNTGFTQNPGLPDMDLGPVTIKKQNGTVSDAHYTARLQGGRVYLSGDGTPSYGITFEVYINLNAYTGNLETTIGATALNDFAYQYRYDEKNRLIEKKLPGKDWEYTVYDPFDRAILTQDANLKSNNKWLFTKYDVFDRVVYSGIWTNPTPGQTRKQLQTLVNNQVHAVWNESKQISRHLVGTPATKLYYSNHSFPKTNFEILKINYFDNYVFDFGFPFALLINPPVKSLATGSKTKVLGSTDSWINTTTYYDDKGRIKGVYSQNKYLDIIEFTEYTLDFIGKTLKTVTLHTRKNTPSVTITNNFTYDHAGRLLTQKQKINNLPEQLIALNTYDELGQLIRKDVGNTEVRPLQQIEYDYNIRGWLKSINNTTRLKNKLFAFDILYDDQEPIYGYGGIGPLYNGNISAAKWKTNNTSTALRGYYYVYDKLNRLRNGFYLENDQITYKYNEAITAYDRNGNMQRLTRNGLDIANPAFTTCLDDLTYTYKGNRLMAVNDRCGTTGNAAEGFKDGNTIGDDYAYDGNGNMLIDKNKGITTNMVYNHLNLPTKIEFSNGGKINYVYDASGTRIARSVVQPGLNDGPTTEYAGNFMYQKATSASASVLQFFTHPEGYVAHNDGNFSYVFQYKDHLGNVRLSYADTNGDGVVTGGSTEIFFDGFESAGGWDSVNAKYGSPITAYDYNRKHSGHYSGKIEKFTEGVQMTHCNQWVPVYNTEDTEYIFSGWIYSDGPRVRLFLFMNREGETDYFTKVEYAQTFVTHRWVYVEKRVVVPRNITKLNIRIDNYGGIPGAGTVWFDDISIRRINPAGSVELVAENNYYPFGWKHKGYNDAVKLNKANAIAQHYKYNSKEWQDELGLNLYDYGMRNYDPAIGRWLNIDPLAENSRRWSPYSYCYNNPIYFVDPDGMLAEPPTDLYNMKGKKIGTDGVNNGEKMVVTDNKEAKQIEKTSGNIDLNNVKSGVALPSDTALKESLNVLDRTIKNGGLKEEVSMVMNDGTVIQGQTGPMPTITNNVQSAPSTLPNLPAGATTADVEATIHSHPTTVQQVGKMIYPQSASTPSTGPGTDQTTFQQFNTNIIVGPLGTISAGSVTVNPNGTLNIPSRPNGAAIYDSNSNLKVELPRKTIENILKN